MMKRRESRGIIFLSVLTLLILAVNEAVIATPTLPFVDGTIRDGYDSPKDGVPDTVIAGSVVVALNNIGAFSEFEDRGIIEFELPVLSSQPLTNAELELNVFSSMGPYPFTVDVYTYVGDGVLSLGDFNAGSLFTSFAYSGESVVTLDVTSFIGTLYTSGDGFAGFNIQMPVLTSVPLNGPYVSFGSLEHGSAAKLRLTPPPIPAPGAVMLGSIGVGLVGWLRRRRTL
jgi:hypothetical protein